MQKIIEVQWENESGSPCFGDAIVEYVRYDEDGKLVNEVIEVFLPDYGPLNVQFAKSLREQAIDAFDNGEGVDL